MPSLQIVSLALGPGKEVVSMFCVHTKEIIWCIATIKRVAKKQVAWLVFPALKSAGCACNKNTLAFVCRPDIFGFNPKLC
jgi:hypothetical protein